MRLIFFKKGGKEGLFMILFTFFYLFSLYFYLSMYERGMKFIFNSAIFNIVLY